jgi:hypothetical protein
VKYLTIKKKLEGGDCLTLKMKPGGVETLSMNEARKCRLTLKMKPGIADCLTLNVSEGERTP